MGILDKLEESRLAKQRDEMSFDEYLDLCETDPSAYASAAERMLKAIGEPELFDTSKDPRLSRIYQNKVIQRYATFSEFYGMEETIEQIVGFFKHAAQGLEESRQVLYFLGPVGSAKSSLAEKLKALMEKEPIYVLEYDGVLSPMLDSPLCLFYENPELLTKIGIAKRYIPIPSAWMTKRIGEDPDGVNSSKIQVVKLYPSILEQLAITKTEPGDETNQDISSLVGKTDVRKLVKYSQDDPDSYGFSGGLCKSNQGLLEFVEMFKAPIKVLHPLLTATQERNFNPTEGFAASPFTGIVLAHSNESEWQTFKNNQNNEAFIDRVCIVKVPYCLRVSEEVMVYEKMLKNSSLFKAPCAPATLKLLATFSVLSRLVDPENSNVYSKMGVYDGENLKDKDAKAKTIQEYKDHAGVDEGMKGISTRFAFKILSKTFNFDPEEVAANPVHLFYILEQQIEREQFPSELADSYLRHLKEHLVPEYQKFIDQEIQTAYLESYADYGQNLFDRYITYADFWIQDQEWRDPETGELLDRPALNKELEKMEKPSGVANPKDFRNEVVNFVLRARANNKGANPEWDSYEKLRSVIQEAMFSNTEDLLPVITFNKKGSKEDQKKHDDFVGRMIERGYTEKQVRLLCEWHLRSKKSQ